MSVAHETRAAEARGTPGPRADRATGLRPDSPDPGAAPGRGGSIRDRLARPRAPSGRAAADAARMMGGLALVMAGTCAVLWALDGVPTWIAGEPRGVRRVATVRDAEHLLRARLALPAYFPATFAWPPSRIRLLAGTPGAVALWVDGRAGGPDLLLAETVAPGAIPARLLPEAQPLDRAPVAVGSSRGTLSRVVQDGVVVWEVAWELDGRSLLLRSRRSAEELIRMARSARETP